MRAAFATLVLLAGLPLGGCVAGLAVGAVSAAGQAVARSGARGDPNIDIAPTARAACTARAAQQGQQGEVRIIDVEDRGPGKAIVWGTIGQGPQRRSFECRYAGKIIGFTVRALGQGR